MRNFDGIHELSLNRYQDAGHTLQEIASHERRVRHKKLSLSIAKLSHLVVTPPNTILQETESVDIGLAAVNAQSTICGGNDQTCH